MMTVEVEVEVEVVEESQMVVELDWSRTRDIPVEAQY